MTDPVDTDALRDMGAALTHDGHTFGPLVTAAANEVDRLRDLLDEYERYRNASPNLSEHARLTLAERILRQMKDCQP